MRFLQQAPFRHSKLETVVKESPFITTCKRSLGQGNIFRSVCQEFCSHGGEYLGRYPPDQVLPPSTRYHQPPGPGTPSRPGTPPGPGTSLGAVHAGRYGQQAGGTHPTGMHYCFLSFFYFQFPYNFPLVLKMRRAIGFKRFRWVLDSLLYGNPSKQRSLED